MEGSLGIVGASGFIGRELARQATAAGWKVGSYANADNSAIAATVVYFGKPADQAAALGVAQSLPGATIQQSTAYDDTGADITVVIGATFTG